MDYSPFHELKKKTSFTYSFLNKKLIHLNLQILNNCNLKCKICDFWKTPTSNLPKLSVYDVKIIADKIKLLRPQIIILGGGEPLLHKNLIEITEILTENNYVMLTSNGWFITDEMAKALWKAGLKQILISLDYADPKNHDYIRGKEGAYQRAVNAVKILHKNRTHPSQRVQIMTTILNDNQEEIEPLIRLSKEMGVTLIVSLFCKCRGNIKYNPIPKDLSTPLLELKKKYRNFVSMRGYLAKFNEAVKTKKGIRPCYAGKNLFNINCNGDISLCIDHLEKPVGNILTDDIFEIEKKLQYEYRNTDCGDCWTSCRGPVETLMYGDNKWANLKDYNEFSRSIALNRSF